LLTTGVWRRPSEGEVSEEVLTDLAKIPSTDRKALEKFAFEEVPKLKSIGESVRIERLKGYKSCYKVRFGSYRVGLILRDGELSFERVLHRREIYRFFP
jgi:mRNA interferase RelE/StbE